MKQKKYHESFKKLKSFIDIDSINKFLRALKRFRI